MLQLNPVQGGTNLSIQQCGNFMTDTNFSMIRDTLQNQSSNLLNQWQQLANTNVAQVNNPNVLNIVNDKDNILFLEDRFELIVDVRGFKPNDVVCTLAQNLIEVSGNKVIKNENPGGGFTEQTQTLQRRYFLPKNVKIEMAQCFLSIEGVLFVRAPWG